ncbi:MAG TPA: hypothetical protein PK108_15315 [Pyrinomonadaceae bacterium]|nr:hypothetical protein [Chloracidobacterium sp.]MBK9767101.1 hypothetical protein [Chloracidobacterium sp.]HRA41908.1 hypothetical protein [Pyrinomonadaceae bacterium]
MKENQLTIIVVVCMLATLSFGCKMGQSKLEITNEQISQALVDNGNIYNKKRSDEEIDFKNGTIDFKAKNIKYCFKVDDKNSASGENDASIDLMLTSTEPQNSDQDTRIAYGRLHLDLVKEGEKWQVKTSYGADLRINTVPTKEVPANDSLAQGLCSNFSNTKK